MMHKTCFLVVLAAGCGAAALAQSVMSVQIPGGIPIVQATGPSLALGGSGVGVENDFFGMASNSGNLGGINQAVFSGVASLDFLSIKEGAKSTRHGTLSPRLLSFAFPLGSIGTFGFSCDRRSSMDYKYRARQPMASTAAEADTADLGVSCKGSLTAWQAGWGYAIGRSLRVGVGYERLYLVSEEISMLRTAFAPISGLNNAQMNDSTSTLLRGNGFRLGILYLAGKFTAGCSGEYVFSGNARQEQSGPHRSGIPVTKVTVQLPPSFSVGASYAPAPEWLTAATFGATLWQRYSSGVVLGGPVDNTVTFSAGAQFVPAPNLLVPRYWEIMQYRAGFRYSLLPIPEASEVALTASIGLPLQQGGGLFDFIVECGQRMNRQHSNYSERFLQVALGINGGRKWFQNTGIRY